MDSQNYIQPCLLNKLTSAYYHEALSNSDCMLGKDNHQWYFLQNSTKGVFRLHVWILHHSSVTSTPVSSINQQVVFIMNQLTSGKRLPLGNSSKATAKCVWCILHNLYQFYTIYIHFTQFISNPCYHENKQRFRMGKITTRYFIKTNSVFFKFHQHVVLRTKARFYTILTKSHIIKKKTNGLRVRKK